MKNLFFILMLIWTGEFLSAQCSSGNFTVTGNAQITGSCIITGDLTVENGATLNVDFTGAAPDTFVVRGNILLKGNGILWIHAATGATGDQFIVSNNFSNERTITTQDSSHLVLENVEFRTQEGDLSNASSIYMNYYAQDNSVFYIDKCWLNRGTAWLLCNLQNKATMQGFEPDGVPTELYIQDTAQAAIHGANTDMGLWLNFESVTCTLTLPGDQSQPFTWNAGRGAGGLATPWYIEVDTAKVGIGVQIQPTAKVTINGTGAPATGELTIALLFANSTDTLNNLQVGLQNTTVANGPNGYVALSNVRLHPIAWQLYALMNEHLYIKNSTINEIGIAGPSTVVVDSSILQLAVLASVGQGGSAMTINNSDIWNQAVTAGNHSSITLNNCNVTGSMFSTTDAQSHITVNGGCFFQNPSGCSQNNMVNISTGLPHCNPFIPAVFPQNLTPAGVTFNGVNSNCTTAINDIEAISNITCYPNPAENLIHVDVADYSSGFAIEICSVQGQLQRRSR